MEALEHGGIEEYLDVFGKAVTGEPVPEAQRVKWRELDMDALRAQLLGGPSGNPNIADVLPTMTMPCLLYCGEEDPRFARMKEMIGAMPNARFFSLPGLTHGGAMMRKELTLPRITEFLQSVTQGAEVH